MPLSKITEIILPVLLTVAIGFIFGRFKRIAIKPVIDVIIYVTVPCLILASILKHPLSLSDLFQIPLAAIFVVLGTGLSAFLVLKLFRVKESPGIYMGSMFINSGIMAFPIVLTAYGREALSKAIIFDATNAILIFTLGIFMLVGKSNFKQIFKLPVIYAAIIAITLNIAGISLPDIPLKTLSTIGDATIPVMLLVLGYKLNYLRPQVLGPSIFSSVMRLGMGLALSLLFVRMFGLTGIIRNVVILSSCMPTAMNSLVLSEEYGVDSELVASTVMITTLLAFATIPLILSYIL